MRSASAIWAVLISLVLASSAHASKAATGTGEPRFGLLLTVANEPQPRLGERFRIRVEAGGIGPRDAVGRASISIPDGFTVEEGDTGRDLHANARWGGGPRGEWDLYLRPTRPGKFTIRGWVRIPRSTPRSWDESECVLDLDVRDDSVIVPRFSRTLRHERIVEGQRFRYGGQHMVLIDGPEPWLAEASGPPSDPEPIDTPVAECRDCGLTGPKVMRYAVTVGTDGSVRWIEPRRPDAPPEDSRVLAAGESALRRWRFRPARIGDRVVANWAEVEVSVHPSER
ncbi:MAG TPA: hypothetical protein VFY90_05710 [Tepidiformaceae bacterium]|jgi:hypothetical protein|nr:hypothetical protein [Tepidiformaceae bacterium]